jgi:hypothetical protein
VLDPLLDPLVVPPLEPLLPVVVPLVVPPLLLDVVPLLEPPQGPQMPCVLPEGMTHEEPGQQSALLVHEPQLGTHADWAQTKGGVPPALGTHGLPLQQSALEAHDPPAATHCPKAQRGTPTLSCRHVSWWQLPEQQLQVSLHDIWLRRQTSPFGLQPIGRRHTPTGPPALRSHVTGLPDPPAMPVDPQQSPSLRQVSPTGWHPLAGWQTSTPVGPHGAHARLQQPPPHCGSPLSRYTTPPSDVPPPHSIPSTSPQFAAPFGGVVPQVPIVCPAATVQLPVQQSAPVEQESPP